MDTPHAEEILITLREIRDGQRDMLALMVAQQARAEDQVQKSRDSVAESVALQRLALQRQRTVAWIALPAILACIAAIAYLVLRYF
jgi:type VI protein secretion system component VasF